jgi:hypothetical protein
VGRPRRSSIEVSGERLADVRDKTVYFGLSTELCELAGEAVADISLDAGRGFRDYNGAMDHLTLGTRGTTAIATATRHATDSSGLIMGENARTSARRANGAETRCEVGVEDTVVAR